MNLRWSWDERTRDLFRWVDPDAWEVTVHDPVALLARVSQARLAELEADPAFRSYLTEVHDALVRYSTRDRWFQGRATSPLRSIAYFSPEFGIAEALPQYSGGLGVLAGDHLKAASDLGVPLVGVGLFYRHGYFRQSLNSDGWQQERYPSLDPFAMALRPVDEGAGHGRPRGHDAHRTGVARRGRPGPAAPARRRRGGERRRHPHRHRPPLRRRHRAPAAPGDPARHRRGAGAGALGEEAQVFHTNEGHAGFLGLERIRTIVTGADGGPGLPFRDALESVRAGSIFTTHTPVPAGIDRFPRRLMERYFSGGRRSAASRSTS
jgi:starch phosphorylase